MISPLLFSSTAAHIFQQQPPLEALHPYIDTAIPNHGPPPCAVPDPSSSTTPYTTAITTLDPLPPEIRALIFTSLQSHSTPLPVLATVARLSKDTCINTLPLLYHTGTLTRANATRFFFGLGGPFGPYARRPDKWDYFWKDAPEEWEEVQTPVERKLRALGLVQRLYIADIEAAWRDMGEWDSGNEGDEDGEPLGDGYRPARPALFCDLEHLAFGPELTAQVNSFPELHGEVLRSLTTGLVYPGPNFDKLCVHLPHRPHLRNLQFVNRLLAENTPNELIIHGAHLCDMAGLDEGDTECIEFYLSDLPREEGGFTGQAADEEGYQRPCWEACSQSRQIARYMLSRM
ncbi:hypothetical protein IAT38_006972 [Cryptococcus sp. DSM 104549]